MGAGTVAGSRAWRQVLAGAGAVACCVVTPWVWWSLQLGPMRPGGSPVYFTYDFFQYSLPHWEYAARMLRRGIVPLWNPYQLCGTPYLAAQNHGILYPFNWLMMLLPVPQAMRVVMCAHYMLAMGGAYWCARVFGAGRPAALLAGGVYAFSGTLVVLGLATTPAMVASAAWLPWHLALTRASLVAERHGNWLATALGAAVAMAFLGGHPQYVLISAQVCGAYAGVHLATVAWRGDGVAVSALSGRLALAGAVAVGLSAVQLLPTADLMLRSPRGPGQLANVGGNNPFATMLPWVGLLRNAVYPLRGTFGTRGDGRMGIAPLALAAAALLSPGVRARVAFFWSVTVCAVLIALADQTPVFRWYLMLPGVALFRVPQRWVIVATLGVAVLGALGADGLRRRSQPREVALSILCGATLLLAIFVVVRHASPALKPVDKEAGRLLREYVALFVVWGALFAVRLKKREETLRQGLILLVAAATVLELYSSAEVRFSVPMNQPDAFDVPWSAAAFIRERQEWARTFALNPSWRGGAVAVVPPKVGMLTGVYAVSDYENLYERRYAAVLDRLAPRPLPPGAGMAAEIDAGQLPLLRMLGVRFILVRRDAGLRLPLGGPVYSDPRYAVYELADSAPRAYVATAVRVEPVPEQAWAAVLGDTNFVLKGGVVLERQEAGELRSSGEVEITRYEPHAVELRARLSRPGVVVLSDEFDPYWVASVDDRPAAVWRANYVFRGVRVEAGEHVLRFEYRPRLVYAGAALTLASLAGILLAAVRTVRR